MVANERISPVEARFLNRVFDMSRFLLLDMILFLRNPKDDASAVARGRDRCPSSLSWRPRKQFARMARYTQQSRRRKVPIDWNCGRQGSTSIRRINFSTPI